MNTKNWLVVSAVLIVLFAGYSLASKQIGSLISNDNANYQGRIDYSKTIFGYKVSNAGVTLDMFDVNQKIVHQKSVSYAYSNHSDLITPILNGGTFFLIQSTNQDINDRIINLESGALTNLGSRGHSVVAENQDAILLANYHNDQLGLVLYEKKNGAIIDTGFRQLYPDAQGIVVEHGLYAGGKWYIPYLSSKGTFVVVMHKKTFSTIKVSQQDLSDLWILAATRTRFEFYSGFISSTNPNSLSIMEPELHDVYLHNGVNLYEKNVNIYREPLGENPHCIGYVSEGHSRYLMLFTQEGAEFAIVLVDASGYSKRIFTSSPIQIESVKINNSIIAVAGSREAFFMNREGDLFRQIRRR